MKKLIIALSFLFSTFIIAQTDVYQKKGVAVEGYDVVSYFEGNAEKGNPDFKTDFEGTTYYFTTQKHLDLFLKAPQKYLPQYGGYCAYAVAKSAEKVSINPKTFLIEDNKLYLFYNSWGVNTLKKWEEENPKELQQQANKNWETLKN